MFGQLSKRRSGSRDPLGAAGERAARRYLKRKGYRVIAQNVCLRVGEADLVCLAEDRRTIVIVEVKARRRGATDNAASESIAPEAAITAHKQHKLREITLSLVKLNKWEDRPVRIDVVAVEWPTDDEGKGRLSKPSIRHYENAVGDARARGTV